MSNIHIRMSLRRGLLACVCLPCWATAMIATGPAVDSVASPAKPGQSVIVAAPTSANGPTVEWVSAVIGGLQLARSEITLRGKPVALHPTRLQVLTSDGRRGELAMLHVGQAIRFALDDAPAPGRRIVLIQIER